MRAIGSGYNDIAGMASSRGNSVCGCLPLPPAEQPRRVEIHVEAQEPLQRLPSPEIGRAHV